MLSSFVTLGLARPTKADPVTFQFTGALTAAVGNVPSLGAGVIGAGSPISGLFTYNVADASISPGPVTFINVNPPAAMTFQLGSLTASTTNGIGFDTIQARCSGRGSPRGSPSIRRFSSVCFLKANSRWRHRRRRHCSLLTSPRAPPLGSSCSPGMRTRRWNSSATCCHSRRSRTPHLFLSPQHFR